VDPHDDETGGFPNVESMKRGFIAFGIGEVVAEEVIVIKKTNNL
jgi:hypothetical protein